MKVAVTIFKNGISPRLDIADSLWVYDTQDGGAVKCETVSVTFEHPAQLAEVLTEKGIHTVLCAACPQYYLRVLISNGFTVIPGATGDPEESVRQLAAIKKLNKNEQEEQMPGGNRRGPLGQGPMTGRGLGYCGGFGGGIGLGRGGGRGRGFGFAPVVNAGATVSEAEETEILRQEAKNLETSLQEVKERLSRLEKDSKKTGA